MLLWKWPVRAKTPVTYLATNKSERFVLKKYYIICSCKIKFMIKVEKIVVGSMRTNCYLIYDDKTHECVIVDPGDEADFISQKITRLNLKPIFIIATHGHFDHVMAVNELKLFYKIPFLIHKKDFELLKNMRRSAIHYIKLDPGPAPKADKYFINITKLKLGNNYIKIIETPGHTRGGIALYLNKQELLFSGDTMFAQGGIGRYDFKYCNKKDLQNSINKLLKLPSNTIIYPGHGDSSIIKFERKFHNVKLS
jgi:hydroxyacylglutathione hydrolase